MFNVQSFSFIETFAQLYLVMLNLFQYLIISVSYETLKQVQGDNYGIMQRSLINYICSIYLSKIPYSKIGGDGDGMKVVV